MLPATPDAARAPTTRTVAIVSHIPSAPRGVPTRKGYKGSATSLRFDAERLAARRVVAERLRSYARQDEKMLRPSDENIRVDQALDKLEQSRLQCAYCRRPVLLFAEAKRDPALWTFDRKENHIAHTNANVVVCCLKCNLKKRRQDTNKFLFAERLTHIVRKGKDDDDGNDDEPRESECYANTP